MKPGRIAFSRTPFAPNSSAALRIIASSAALPAVYAPNQGWVTWAAIEDMPTKEPPPAATRRGTACLMQSMVPSAFRCSTRRNSSTGCTS